MITSKTLWDARAKEVDHTDWYCSYDHLRPLLQPLLDRPRATALVLGSGTSAFPEQLYDLGCKEVLVVDTSPVAMEVVRERNKSRQGMYCMEFDPGEGMPSPPAAAAPGQVNAADDAPRAAGPTSILVSRRTAEEGKDRVADGRTNAREGEQQQRKEKEHSPHHPPSASGSSQQQPQPQGTSGVSGGSVDSLRFDLAVDKGTLDLMLTLEDGWQRAARTLAWVYARMRTPSTLLLVSHSPPEDRIELLMSVYWNDIQFRTVETSTIEDLIRDPSSYQEGPLRAYPYSVPAWESEKALRALAAGEGKGPKGAREVGKDIPGQGGQQHHADGGSHGHKQEKKAAAAPIVLPSRPTEDLGFAPGVAYIYILEK